MILSVLTCFALLPQMQAAPQVAPPPDGCYPGFTTAEGCNALALLGAGAGNTGVGWYSLFSVVDANFNTGVGAGTLVLNTGDSNTAVGAAALLLNTIGTENTAVGTDALVYNDTGSFNSAVGVQALFSNTTGSFNTAIGNEALFSNTEGNDNVAIGGGTLVFNNTGSENTAIGRQALIDNTTGDDNTANGFQALLSNHEGHNNTAIGVGALSQNVSGSFNTALGDSAGTHITGDGNVCLGYFILGETGVDNRTYVANVGGTSQPIGGTVFGVTVDNTTCKLGFQPSSRRYKEDIKAMDKASETLFALEPVTFRYKKQIDPKQHLDYGLLAEDVAKLNPELAIRNGKGEIESLNYGAIYAMMLNEFLKEHKKVAEQQATIAELKSTVAQQRKDFEATIVQQQKGIEVLTAQIKDQGAQIQKVSAQFQVRKPAPQVVVNKP